MAWINKQPLPIHAPHPSVRMGWLYVCVIRCLVLFVCMLDVIMCVCSVRVCLSLWDFCDSTQRVACFVVVVYSTWGLHSSAFVC